MSIETYCEYTLPQLAKLGGVCRADLARMPERAAPESPHAANAKAHGEA